MRARRPFCPDHDALPGSRGKELRASRAEFVGLPARSDPRLARGHEHRSQIGEWRQLGAFYGCAIRVSYDQPRWRNDGGERIGCGPFRVMPVAHAASIAGRFRWRKDRSVGDSAYSILSLRVLYEGAYPNLP